MKIFFDKQASPVNISKLDMSILDIPNCDTGEFMDALDFSDYLPLSEATFYVLVSLDEPMHGYAVMQKVEAISGGSVVIGPGTLYGAIATLEKQQLIVKVREEERRKLYGLTERGQQVLAEQIRRLKIMVANGQKILDFLQGGGA